MAARMPLRRELNSTACVFFKHLETRNITTSSYLCKPRTKREARLRRPPANTRLRTDVPEKVTERKAYGGRKKLKALKIQKGNYLLHSKGIEIETPILDVIHSDANQKFADLKIMVKGTIVELDGTKFKEALKDQPKYSEETITLNQVEAQDVQDEQHTKNEHAFDSQLLLFSKLLDNNRLYGKITTRPGQVGACDGYVLEGEELENLIKKLKIET